MSQLMNSIIEKAKGLNKRIVLPESHDERVVKAAAEIAAQGIAHVILLGDKKELRAQYPDTDLSKVEFIGISNNKNTARYRNEIYEMRKAKGLTIEEAARLAANPLYFATMMLKDGLADGMVAGSVSATGDVLRPALQIVKTAQGISTVSSCFIMVMKDDKFAKDNGIMIFADCAVIPEPNADQLAAIAIASAQSAKAIAGIDPKVAMLSFSTKGSAKHPLADKVIEATAKVKAIAPWLLVDGELQADAAIVDSVAALKAPNSVVAGSANVLVFPDLQSGNIGYKLVQRYAGADAIGPIIQGLAKPVNDLSRGCSVEDIVNVVAITALQSVTE
jgi:phosphate acetyltransferase